MGIFPCRSIERFPDIRGGENKKKTFAEADIGKDGSRTFHRGIGGSRLCDEEQERVNQIVREAIDHGINYFMLPPPTEMPKNSSVQPGGPLGIKSFWPARPRGETGKARRKSSTSRCKDCRQIISTSTSSMR